MNNVQLVGRLTRDPDIRQANSGMTIASWTTACDRRFKHEGEPTADFISCRAFGKTAEFIERYFHKGQRIGLTGRIQTVSYEKDGRKVYTTDVIADNVEFVESKSSVSGGAGIDEAMADERRKTNAALNYIAQQAAPKSKPDDDFMQIPDGIGEELPFA